MNEYQVRFFMIDGSKETFQVKEDYNSIAGLIEESKFGWFEHEGKFVNLDNVLKVELVSQDEINEKRRRDAKALQAFSDSMR